MEQQDSATAVAEGYRRWEDRNREFGRLLTAARAGSVAAFEQLYDSSARWLLSVVRRLVDDGQAEDVLAEVYLQAWNQLGQYDPARGPPSVWLAMMARSRALDHLRREKLRRGEEAAEPPDLAGEQDNPEEILSRLQQSRLVRLSLADLDQQERLVIALAYFQECTHTEISRRTGLPLSTVRNSMSRAQQKLRSSLLVAGAGCARSIAP